MIRRPATDAFRQRGCGESGSNTHPDLEGMHRTSASLQRFVESPPEDHWTKERGKRGAMLPAATIGPSFEPQVRRRLCRALGLHVIQNPGDNAASDFP